MIKSTVSSAVEASKKKKAIEFSVEFHDELSITVNLSLLS